MLFISCGQKDSDIKASVEEKLKTNTDMAGPMTVAVNDGVVTISGECKDDACKAKCEDLAKSVTLNTLKPSKINNQLTIK